MKSTDMNYEQVMEFTGMERRLPTETEIELLVGHSAATMFEQIVKRDKISITKQPSELQKLIQQTKQEWLANAYVLDFKSVGKRLVFHHQIKVALQDHEDIKKFFNNIGITSSMVEESTNTLGEEFREAVKRSTTVHNHILVGHYCVLIDADDKVVFQDGYDMDLCLRETEKKEKKAESTENVS